MVKNSRSKQDWALRRLPSPHVVVLIGLMGVGKSTIGRRLAPRLGLPFFDSDIEIEAAAGCSVSEFFADYGEAAFRDGERRVIARLLDSGPCVLATGGGSFLDAETRQLIAQRGLSIWLRADVEVMLRRVSRRQCRPLLTGGSPRDILEKLVDQRYPIYSRADITVETGDQPTQDTVDRVFSAIRRYCAEFGEHAEKRLDHSFQPK